MYDIFVKNKSMYDTHNERIVSADISFIPLWQWYMFIAILILLLSLCV